MQNRSQLTRERILQTSFDLFLQNGYDTTGVARICEEAQISKGAFYHHFPSKHDLFLAILDDWIEKLENRFLIIQTSTQSVPNQLKLMAETMKDIFSESVNIPIFLEFWMQSMRDESVSARTIAPYFHFVKYFEEVTRKGVEEGSFSSKVNPAQTARVLMAYAMGTIVQSMIEPEKNWQELSQSGLQDILSGLIKEQ